ncbi:hypothetical protein EV648_10766 [Kribbella sp. VKM Ac-2568]|nr:hypothetical protein EV648_10766 [Kribbella sp. VKM Ac-2568]
MRIVVIVAGLTLREASRRRDARRPAGGSCWLSPC